MHVRYPQSVHRNLDIQPLLFLHYLLEITLLITALVLEWSVLQQCSRPQTVLQICNAQQMDDFSLIKLYSCIN